MNFDTSPFMLFAYFIFSASEPMSERVFLVNSLATLVSERTITCCILLFDKIPVALIDIIFRLKLSNYGRYKRHGIRDTIADECAVSGN